MRVVLKLYNLIDKEKLKNKSELEKKSIVSYNFNRTTNIKICENSIKRKWYY